MVETADILSTVFRRTHRYLEHNPLQSETSGGMWKLVEIITRRAAIQYGRKNAAARNAERQWWRNHGVISHHAACADPVCGAMPPSIENQKDTLEHHILRMRAEGMTHAQIACSLGVGEDLVRQRWSRMRHRALEHWKNGRLE